MDSNQQQLPQVQERDINKIYGYEEETEKERNFMQMLLEYLRASKERDMQRLKQKTSV